MWQCTNCSNTIYPPSKRCPHCGNPTSIPSNVVIAGTDHTNLMQRLKGCKQLYSRTDWKFLCNYKRTINQNISVSINMRFGSLINILQDKRIRYTNLHDNLRAEAIMDYDPELAAKRRGVDNLVFGADGERLNYGAINLGNIGLFSYGPACVFLKVDAIKDTVSFLEENSFYYTKGSWPVLSINMPSGVRALWPTASTLTLVKHHNDLIRSKRWSNSKLADLILYSAGDKKTDRFIEAQIYHPITVRDFRKILFEPASLRPTSTGSLIGRTSAHDRELSLELLKLYTKGHSITVKVAKKRK